MDQQSIWTEPVCVQLQHQEGILKFLKYINGNSASLLQDFASYQHFWGLGLDENETWARYDIYRVSQEECARLRESVPYVKVYRYNPKHLYTIFFITVQCDNNIY